MANHLYTRANIPESAIRGDRQPLKILNPNPFVGWVEPKYKTKILKPLGLTHERYW